MSGDNSDDDAPIPVSFAESRSTAELLLRSVRRAVSEQNRQKREKRRERDESNIAQKTRKLESTRAGGGEGEQSGEGSGVQKMEVGGHDQRAERPHAEKGKVNSSDNEDDGYHGSSEDGSAGGAGGGGVGGTRHPLPNFLKVCVTGETSAAVRETAQSRAASFRDNRLFNRQRFPRLATRDSGGGGRWRKKKKEGAATVGLTPTEQLRRKREAHKMGR